MLHQRYVQAAYLMWEQLEALRRDAMLRGSHEAWSQHPLVAWCPQYDLAGIS